MLWFYNKDATKCKKYPMYSWHARPASESLGKRLEKPKTLIVTMLLVTVLLVTLLLCYSRLLSCPNKVNFFKKVMNWIDLFAIIPYFVTVVILNIYMYICIIYWDEIYIIYNIISHTTAGAVRLRVRGLHQFRERQQRQWCEADCAVLQVKRGQNVL